MTDSNLRMFSFIATIPSALLLTLLIGVAVRAKRLSPGEIAVRLGFIALLVSIFYGTAEQLWHWYHLRLWILALAVLWTLIGVLWITAEYLTGPDTRRHHPTR